MNLVAIFSEFDGRWAAYQHINKRGQEFISLLKRGQAPGTDILEREVELGESRPLIISFSKLSCESKMLVALLRHRAHLRRTEVLLQMRSERTCFLLHVVPRHPDSYSHQVRSVLVILTLAHSYYRSSV